MIFALRVIRLEDLNTVTGMPDVPVDDTVAKVTVVFLLCKQLFLMAP